MPTAPGGVGGSCSSTTRTRSAGRWSRRWRRNCPRRTGRGSPPARSRCACGARTGARCWRACGRGGDLRARAARRGRPPTGPGAASGPRRRGARHRQQGPRPTGRRPGATRRPRRRRLRAVGSGDPGPAPGAVGRRGPRRRLRGPAVPAAPRRRARAAAEPDRLAGRPRRLPGDRLPARARHLLRARRAPDGRARPGGAAAPGGLRRRVPGRPRPGGLDRPRPLPADHRRAGRGSAGQLLPRSARPRRVPRAARARVRRRRRAHHDADVRPGCHDVPAAGPGAAPPPRPARRRRGDGGGGLRRLVRRPDAAVGRGPRPDGRGRPAVLGGGGARPRRASPVWPRPRSIPRSGAGSARTWGCGPGRPAWPRSNRGPGRCTRRGGGPRRTQRTEGHRADARSTTFENGSTAARRSCPTWWVRAGRITGRSTAPDGSFAWATGFPSSSRRRSWTRFEHPAARLFHHLVAGVC